MTKHKCDHCREEFRGKNRLIWHINVQHSHFSQQKFPCNNNKCEKSYETLTGLLKHIKKFHNNEKWQCSDCGRKFIYEYQFVQHGTCKYSERKFVCNIPVCKKRFSSKGHLNAHIKGVHDSSEFQCSDSDEKFMSEDLLVKHRTCKHPEYNQGKFVFNDNDERSVENTAVNTDLRFNRHDPENFKCTYKDCGLVFEKKYVLVMHQVSAHPEE